MSKYACKLLLSPYWLITIEWKKRNVFERKKNTTYVTYVALPGSSIIALHQCVRAIRVGIFHSLFSFSTYSVAIGTSNTRVSTPNGKSISLRKKHVRALYATYRGDHVSVRLKTPLLGSFWEAKWCLLVCTYIGVEFRSRTGSRNDDVIDFGLLLLMLSTCKTAEEQMMTITLSCHGNWRKYDKVFRSKLAYCVHICRISLLFNYYRSWKSYSKRRVVFFKLKK